MNLPDFLRRLRGSPDVLQLGWCGNCVTAQEAKRFICGITAQRSRPRIHCFLGKRNVFESEAILEMLERHGFTATFSPGRGQRLNDDEIFHLVNFLDVLRMNHERNDLRRAFYRSWRDELLANGRRAHRSGDVILRSPQRSAPLGMASKLRLLFGRNGVSQPQVSVGTRTLADFFEKRTDGAAFGPTRERLESGGWSSIRISVLPEQEECALIQRAFEAGRRSLAAPVTSPRILICGWYGTETLGDKAILGGVIDIVRRRWPQIAIDLAALEPHVSRMTVRQMPDLGIDRVLTLGEAFATVTAAEYSAVAIGGGPLMSSIPWCTHLLEIFAAAKQVGTKCLIAGCGIGPLYVDYRNPAIKHLLEIADEVVLRDQASARLARDVLGVERTCEVALDPAFIWIRRRLATPLNRDQKQILLALRDWPIEEFAARMERTHAERIKAAYEKQLVVTIRELLRIDSSVKIVPFCMHKYAVGGDDRIFYRRLLTEFPDILARLDNRHRTPSEDLHLIARSRAVLAMRFHSVIFSLATKTPFLAVDYTLGGKINGLLDDVGGKHLLISIERFDGAGTAARLLSLEEPGIDLSAAIAATEHAIEECFALMGRRAATDEG